MPHRSPDESGPTHRLWPPRWSQPDPPLPPASRPCAPQPSSAPLTPLPPRHIGIHPRHKTLLVHKQDSVIAVIQIKVRVKRTIGQVHRRVKIVAAVVAGPMVIGGAEGQGPGP